MARPCRRRLRPIVEGLDDRCMLSGAGLTPAEVATAYGLGGLSFGGRAADGSGQTIAIVDAYNDPNIAIELAAFDLEFNLPAPPSLTVVGQTGSTTLSLRTMSAGRRKRPWTWSGRTRSRPGRVSSWSRPIPRG